MEPLPREIGGLLPWLPAARWFSAKSGDGKGYGKIVLHDAARIPTGSPPTWIGLIDLIPQGTSGEPARFFLPMSAGDGGFIDASGSDAFVAWLLKTVLTDDSIPAGLGGFKGRSVSRGEPPTCDMPLAIVEVGGDASNTTLSVSWGDGKAVIVKLVRRCRAGIHPEVEVGRFLAESPVRADVPRLVGWLDYEPSGPAVDGGPATVAIVHERVESLGSAWDAMLAMAMADWPRCLSVAAALGETTARLHAGLSSRDDDPAFAPEPWTADAWKAAVSSMANHADRVLGRLERLRETAAARIAEDLAAVVALRSTITRVFTESEAGPPASKRIRVHGDYHLGQVLVDRDGDRCVVIDFEGEPGRTLEERRDKTSAAKDVAGMCRSFDYLLRVLAKEGRRPYDALDLELLESRFLSAYETASRTLAAVRTSRNWWPDDRAEAGRLLALYKLDKALYELAYEADHRPDWIDVPLAAVAAVGRP